jgi:YD repeat-containing protein
MDQTFTYDPLDRLATATGPNGLPQVWAYDAHGNRQTSSGSTTYTYEPGTLRLASQGGIPYTYDSNGNLKTAGGGTYTYSPENWLTSAAVAGGTATYAYDADGWRTRKTLPGESTFYVRGLTNEVLTEWHYTASGTTARDYVYAGTRLLAAIDRVTPLSEAGCEGESRPDGSPIPVTVATPGGSASVTFEGSGCRSVSILATQTSGNLGLCWKVELRRADNNALLGTGNQSGSCGGPAFLEPLTLPVSGEFRAVVVASGSGSGSATVQIFDVVDAMTPINSDGLPVPTNLLTPGQNARLPFTGTTGQQVSALVNVTSGNLGCNWVVEIRRSDTNDAVANPALSCWGSSVFLEPVTLPNNGDYVVVVNPERHSTGSAAVHLYNASDVTTPITPDGTPVSIDLTAPGRNTRLPFSGLADQKISVWVTVSGGGFGCVWYTEIRRAVTHVLVGTSAGSCGTVGFLEPVTLPADGNYEVVVNPSGSSGGTATVRLYAVTDVAGSISLTGTAVPVSLLTPGQNARLTFSGTTDQRVSALATVTSGNLGCVWKLQILKPDLNPLGDMGSCNNTAFREPLTLPSPGTYTVVVDPSGYQTGTASVAVYDVPQDVTGSLTVNGSTVPVSLTAPGHNAQFTFDGTEGQQVTVRLTGNTIGTTYVYLRRPNGTTQASGGHWVSSFNLSTQTLQTSGTYTVLIDPYQTNVGNISVQVTSP